MDPAVLVNGVTAANSLTATDFVRMWDEARIMVGRILPAA